MRKKRLPKLLYADAKGNIYDHPELCMAGMSGPEAVLPESVEIIPLPEGSRIFTVPDTPPIAWDEKRKQFVTLGFGPGGQVDRVADSGRFRLHGARLCPDAASCL